MVCDFTNRVLDKFGCDLTREDFDKRVHGLAFGWHDSYYLRFEAWDPAFFGSLYVDF